MSDDLVRVRDYAELLVGVEFEKAVERAWARHCLESEPSWAPEFGPLLRKTFRLGYSSAVADAARNVVRAATKGEQ